MSSKFIRVLVVDDHALLRQAIERILERAAFIEIVGQCGSGGRAVAMHAELRPDVTLMDFRMPGMDGIEALSAIRRACPCARVLMMTLHPSEARTRRAVQAGAAGCVPKAMLHRHLRDAIRIVHGGGAYFPTQADFE